MNIIGEIFATHKEHRMIHKPVNTDSPGFARRNLLLGGSALVAASMLPPPAFAAPASTGRTQAEASTVQNVEFDNNGITMAGNLYMPAGFDSSQRYAAIISVHPGGGVKEPA